MATSVRTTAWTTSWGGNLYMFRSEVNGHHENQEVCLKLFPPQITAGETAVARLESIDPFRTPQIGVGPSWQLVHGNTQLGRAESSCRPVNFQFDQPGVKQIYATIDRAGDEREVIARSELVVHSLVDGEVEFIVNNLDEFTASRWFRSLLDRHHDSAYKEQLDRILSRCLVEDSIKVQKTALVLLEVLHEQAIQKLTKRFFGRDIHLVNDAIQDAMGNAWRSIHRFQSGKRFGPWFHQILLNACLDTKKGSSKTLSIVDRQAVNSEGCIDAIDAKDQVERFTRKLKAEEIRPLILRHVDNLGFIDIAKELRIQEGSPDATRVTTVRRRIEKATNALRAEGRPNLGGGERGGLHV